MFFSFIMIFHYHYLFFALIVATIYKLKVIQWYNWIGYLHTLQVANKWFYFKLWNNKNYWQKHRHISKNIIAVIKFFSHFERRCCNLFLFFLSASWYFLIIYQKIFDSGAAYFLILILISHYFNFKNHQHMYLFLDNFPEILCIQLIWNIAWYFYSKPRYVSLTS